MAVDDAFQLDDGCAIEGMLSAVNGENGAEGDGEGDSDASSGDDEDAWEGEDGCY